MNLAGKRILITGAGQGIGRAIAQHVAQCGGTVIGLSRSAAPLEELANDLGCETLCWDLMETEGLEKALQRSFPFHGLVNNAGMTALAPFIDHQVDDYDSVMSVNVKAAMIVSQIVAQGMLQEGCSGSIVNISSVASSIGVPDHTAYCASKGALEAITRVLAVELGPAGIRANCICPTVTMTEMGIKAWSDEAKRSAILKRIPLGRFVEPLDVARLAVFLLSDASSMITGQALNIDGGLSVA